MVPVPDVHRCPCVWVLWIAELDAICTREVARGTVPLPAEEPLKVGPCNVEIREPLVDYVDDPLPVCVLDRPVDVVCATLAWDASHRCCVVPDKVLDDCPPCTAPACEGGLEVALDLFFCLEWGCIKPAMSTHTHTTQSRWGGMHHRSPPCCPSPQRGLLLLCLGTSSPVGPTP